jgi:hypothetical protein
MLAAAQVRAELLKVVDADCLPQEYGGDCCCKVRALASARWVPVCVYLRRWWTTNGDSFDANRVFGRRFDASRVFGRRFDANRVFGKRDELTPPFRDTRPISRTRL